MFECSHTHMQIWLASPVHYSNITNIQFPREATHVPPDSFFRDSFTNCFASRLLVTRVWSPLSHTPSLRCEQLH